MNRREFLRNLVVVPVVGYALTKVDLLVRAGVPPQPQQPLRDYYDFDYAAEYGQSIPITGRWEAQDQRWVINKLVHHARQCLPKGQRFELRMKIPTDYGRCRGIAWYRNQIMQREPHWKVGVYVYGKPLRIDRYYGHMLVGKAIA